MEIRIRNIYNSDVIKHKANYVRFHSGVEVAWIHVDSDITTVSLFIEHYKVSVNDNTIHIKRR